MVKRIFFYEQHLTEISAIKVGTPTVVDTLYLLGRKARKTAVNFNDTAE